MTVRSRGRAVVDVTTSVVVERPVEQVAAYAGDPSRAPEWYVNIRSVAWETPPPLAVGTRLQFRASFLGRTLRYTYEVLELVPGARLVMATTEGPAMETTYTWEPVGQGATRMSLRNRGSAGPRLLAPLAAAAVRRATTKDLRRLKALLEGGS